MTILRWLLKRREGAMRFALVLALALGLILTWNTTGFAPPGNGEIVLRFSDRTIFVSVVDIPFTATFTAHQYPDRDQHGNPGVRAYVTQLFNTVKPVIDEIYGKASQSVIVTLYYTPNTTSWYFRGLPGVNIPENSLFLNRLPDLSISPNDKEFDHLFTHELIHAWHDAMDFFGWYDRSWVEEGMTEAAAELVADILCNADEQNRCRGRDIRGDSIGNAPWMNLKYYDMWSFPANGTWVNQPWSFQTLGGIQFFQSTPGVVDPKVIPTWIRYGAATALWLILAKALSNDPHRPDFLARLNNQLYRKGITELEGGPFTGESNEPLISTIAEIAGTTRIDGLPAKNWVQIQPITRFDSIQKVPLFFISVEEPDDPRIVRIYAFYREDSLIGAFRNSERPIRGCEIMVEIADHMGQVLARLPAQESPNPSNGVGGEYEVSVPPNLLPGGYSIRAEPTSGPCLTATPAFTYVISGASITGEDPNLYGVAGRQDGLPGRITRLEALPASVGARPLTPASARLRSSVRGARFVVEPAGTQPPSVVEIHQSGHWEHKNRIIVSKPNPYARIVWLDVSPDFVLLVDPGEGEVTLGTDRLTTSATVDLIPNGIRPGTTPACAVRLLATVLGVPRGSPSGIRAEIDPILSSVPATAQLTVRVDPTIAKPGTYDIQIDGFGDGACQAIVHTTFYKLTILQSAQLEPPRLQVQPTSLNFSAQVGGPNPPVQTLEVTNIGGIGTLNWTASTDAGWISISPTSGTAPSTVSVSVNIAGMSAGTHQGRITVTNTASPDNSVQVLVTLTLTGPSAGPLKASVSATAKQVCSPNFSHELTVSWKVTGGVPPISVTIEITGPDGKVETIRDLPLEGERKFQLNYPGGGSAKIKVIAKDASGSSSSAQASVRLGACQ